ncbi:MAG: SurA N-terminal domain-containing protein, partial [Acidobacteria bacterium]|nr:SurA N-terminal domain-containing protein [Acidobacteriota bacterium]
LPMWAGQLLDRTIATVNDHVLLQSEWEDELRYECFMAKRSLKELSIEDRKAALDRLIDQELLREQMHSAEFKLVSAAEVDQQIEKLRGELTREAPSDAWRQSLSGYGISEKVIRDHIELELNQLRLLDARLRPSIQIDAPAVESYYREQMLPKLPPGQRPVLEQVAPQIRELLVETKMNELLNSWLGTLRTQARIKVLVSEFSASIVEGQ